MSGHISNTSKQGPTSLVFKLIAPSLFSFCIGSITVNVFNNDVPKRTWRNFLSQKRSKLCHDPSSISFDRLCYICIWKITKLKLTTSWSHSGFQRSIGTIMSFCCKYLKSEMIRCVGSFTSCDLARSKRLKTSKDSQSILLISPGAKSAI